MGLIYNGDLEGKLFHRLHSFLADLGFGGKYVETQELIDGFHESSYYFHWKKDRDLPFIQQEIKKLKEEIGPENYEALKKILKNEHKIPGSLTETWEKYLDHYRIIYLGEQIESCLITKGECTFQSQLF